VHSREAQLADIGQSRAAQEQSAFPYGGVTLANNEYLGAKVVPGAASHRVFGAYEGEILRLLSLEDAKLVGDVLLE
jgi:hypothetical protein